MRTTTYISLLALTACIVPLFAHHNVAEQYNIDTTITVQGTVTKTDWTNPHTRFWVDVRDNNNVANWEMELPPPNTLRRQGIAQDFLKPGDQVTVEMWVAKDGSKFSHPLTLHLPDGRTLQFPRDLLWRSRPTK